MEFTIFPSNRLTSRLEQIWRDEPIQNPEHRTAWRLLEDGSFEAFAGEKLRVRSLDKARAVLSALIDRIRQGRGRQLRMDL